MQSVGFIVVLLMSLNQERLQKEGKFWLTTLEQSEDGAHNESSDKHDTDGHADGKKVHLWKRPWKSDVKRMITKTIYIWPVTGAKINADNFTKQ